MKKYFILIIAVCLTLGLVACSQADKKTAKTPKGAAPMIVMIERNYFVSGMPVNELPEGYEYMGDLTEEESNNTYLIGCKYYVNKSLDSLNDFYVYQECGTPISEDTVDPTQRQWAYVLWVLEN